MSTCTICPRQLRPDEAHRTACSRCEHRIRRWLREIPKQLPLLEASLQRDSTPTQGSRHGGQAHAPMPLREDVLTLLGPAAPGTVHDPHHDQAGPTPIHAVLHAWASLLAADRRKPLPRLPPGETYGGYLAAHLPYALTRPWIAELHQELADLITRIRAITRTEPRRRPCQAPCPNCQAFALVRTDGEPYIECANQECGHLLTPDEYLAHRQRVMAPLARLGVLMVAAQNPPPTAEPTDNTMDSNACSGG